MDRDERIGMILAAIGAAWMFAGLALLMLLARWLRTACGVCPVEEAIGLLLLGYSLSPWAFAVASMYFHVRSRLRSGDASGIVRFAVQVALTVLIGLAIWRLLRGG